MFLFRIEALEVPFLRVLDLVPCMCTQAVRMDAEDVRTCSVEPIRIAFLVLARVFASSLAIENDVLDLAGCSCVRKVR
jgi:hypothetical protein